MLMQASRFPLLDSYRHRLRTGVEFSWQAAIELLLIGVVVYVVLRFLQGTRGARLMQAVLVIMSGMLVLSLFARLFQLDRILVLYPYFVGATFLITLVVFQPELRRGLTRIGERLGRSARTAQSSKLIESIVTMAGNLSRRKIGALVAIERRVPVGGIMETGCSLDAEISHELLETIFWPGSALHDLGVIISQGRIAAAGCEFPLAEADTAGKIIGSRHRAALGMSLETDALVIVVSEETGAVSVASRGRLRRDLDADHLRQLLAAALLSGIEESTAEAEEKHEQQQEQMDEDAADKSVATTVKASIPSEKLAETPTSG
jgi:diadenylate cyclase